MNKLTFVVLMALSGCAAEATDRAQSPVDVNLTAAARVAVAPPGSLDFVVREGEARAAIEMSPPETSIRPGICEKPSHLFARPSTNGEL